MFKYHIFYYTVNIADFQSFTPVAFFHFNIFCCFVKNPCFPLLYIQKAGNEPSRSHSAAFLLSKKRKGGENLWCQKLHRSNEQKSICLFTKFATDFIRQIGLSPNTGIWLNTEVLQRNRIQLGSKMRYSTMDRQAVFFIVYRKNHLEI